MSTEANKAIVIQLYEEVWNRGDLDLADKLVAPNAVDHEPQRSPGAPGGPQGLKAVVTTLRSAFPDDHSMIEDLIAEGDQVVARLTHTGTHLGAFLDLPPTGKHVSTTSIHIFRFADGQLVEHWASRDDIGLMQQPGAIAAKLAIPDRTVLRRQLEETCSAFQAVVESLTDADWHRKTSSTSWTIGEVLTHLASTLAHTPEAIEHLRQGKNYLNPPSFLSWLGPLINRKLAQQSARGQTRASILAWYNTAHTAMLATVEGIGDDEWGQGAYCFGAGYKTILDLCQYLPSHFQEHAAQIAASK